MAAIFEQVPVSKDKDNPGPRTEFSGASDQDIQIAKTFWQSIQLLPPLESRLISADIGQRLRVAGPGHSTVTRFYAPPPPTVEKAASYYQRLVYLKARQDQQAKLFQLQKHKQEVKALFVKRQEIRQAKDAVAKPFCPDSPPPPLEITLPDKMAGDF